MRCLIQVALKVADQLVHFLVTLVLLVQIRLLSLKGLARLCHHLVLLSFLLRCASPHMRIIIN